MDVTIDAIKFNHDLNSATTDALTIRKNQNEEIAVPEWRWKENGTPCTSAAAYARSQGNALTIAVRVRRLDASVRSVRVSAQSRSVLGNVAEETFDFRSGDLSEFKILRIVGASVGQAGVARREVEFQWRLEAISNKNSNSTFQQRTKHTIYTLLEPPKPPWGPDEKQPKFEFPWTEVLEKACDWAREARTRTEVASMITRQIHSMGLDGKLQFEENRSFSRLAFNGTDAVDLAEFLRHLEKSSDPLIVNCTDCAILVSTFANILGCDLYQSQMGYRFRTNPIRVIGYHNEKVRTFEYHEVAWEYPCNTTAKLFDCCLQVDGDPVPSGGRFEPLLPVNIALGDPKTKDYHFRLANRAGGEHCTAFSSTKIRRRIVRGHIGVRRIHPELERRLKEEFDFSSWQDLPSPDRLFSRSLDKLSEGFTQELWKLERIRVLNGDDLDLSEAIWQSNESDNVAVRILTYKFASVSGARAFLLNLLGDFQFPVIERRLELRLNAQSLVIGDLAFSGPEDRMLLFARSNLVVFLQNARSAFIEVTRFAHDLDLQIQKVLRAEQDHNVQSLIEETEIYDRKPQIISSTSSEKEENAMPINLVDTKWSSIRPPRVSSPGPADLRRDGMFRFRTYNPASGAVTGTFYDALAFENKDFEGSVTPAGNGVYIFSLNHEVPGSTEFKRFYEGQTIAEVNQISVVGGQWIERSIRKLDDKGNRADGSNAQEEGVWVATKP